MITFWSSVVLTGNQTSRTSPKTSPLFWSSVVLTGNQTNPFFGQSCCGFWSSVVLTGNQARPTAPQTPLRYLRPSFVLFVSRPTPTM